MSAEAQSLAQQAWQAAATSSQAVIWLPSLHLPTVAVAHTSKLNRVYGSDADEADDDSSDDEREDGDGSVDAWKGSKDRQKQVMAGSAACVVRKADLVFVIPVAADGELYSL